MNKILYVQMVFLIINIISCGDGQKGYATVTIYNQSDYDVTDITVWFGGGQPYLELLKVGEDQTFDLEWENMPASNYTIEYQINGKLFGVEHEEGAILHPGDYYYSPQFLKNGAKAHIYIKNESYELIIEGGGYWEDPGLSPIL